MDTSDRKPEEKDAPPPPRTMGLKLFDVLLYPIFTNVAVFGISVAATYLTARGGQRDASGKLLFGKVGEWFQNRGKWMTDKFKATGMSESQADMSKMVLFSFVDGSIMAPFVKMFEDRREQIGRWLDDKLGTKPADDSVYAAEPRQTWMSVLGGRFLTAAIVVPTAVALDKTGLNDRFFNKPGEKMGEWLEKKPTVKKYAGSLDVKELSRIGVFEAFYTSVCTLGLYFSSRFLADYKNNNKSAAAAEDPLQKPSAVSMPREDSTTEDTSPAIKAKTELKHHKPTAMSGGYREKYVAEPANNYTASL